MSRRNTRSRLTIERLEDRLVPSVYTINDPGITPAENDDGSNGDDAPNEYNVDGHREYTNDGKISIVSVLDALQDGDEIRFAGPMTIDTSGMVGDFGPEYVSIATRITITGQPGVVIENGTTSGTLSLTGSGSRISHVQIQNTTSGIGVALGLGSGVTVDDCTMSGQYASVAILGDGNSLENCKIGTDPEGTAATGCQCGVIINGANNVVRNSVVSGNSECGIYILGDNNTLAGNTIGLSADGNRALPNKIGVFVVYDDHFGGRNNTIGGTDVADRNWISGNTAQGIYLSRASDAKVLNNVIGLAKNGHTPIPNQTGVYLVGDASNIQIGQPGASNVISGNERFGVVADEFGDGSTDMGITIQSNLIGTTASGDQVGNGWGGICIAGSNVHVGADQASDDAAVGNKIAYNGESKGLHGHGIKMVGGTGNTIRLNQIYMNEGLGIDLGNDFVDRIEASRTGKGANLHVWHPSIVRFDNPADRTNVRWMLNAPAGDYTLDFYSDPDNHDAQYAEGAEHLGTLRITVPASGHWEGVLPYGAVHITATATDANGNTSEFSLADRDADGLCDTWETTTGIDLDGDGTPELVLPGANPDRRDIYVQYASMAGWAPVPGVMADVAAVFASQGITLHTQANNQSLPAAGFGGNFWGSFQAIKHTDFAGGAGFGTPEYTANLLAYHYCIFGVSYGNPAIDSSGYSEILGNDLMVTLWSIRMSRSTIRSVQAGTFLHELGHNLGLTHTGAAAWDNSPLDPSVPEGGPTYHSVMNYYYQAPGIFDNHGQASRTGSIFNYSANDWSHLWLGFQEDREAAAGGDGSGPIGGGESQPPLPPGTADLLPLSATTLGAFGQANPVTFTLVNLGATADGSTLTVSLPAGIDVGAISVSQGTFTRTGTTVVASFGTLASLAESTLTIVATPTAVGSLEFPMTATSTTTEGLPGNNAGTQRLSVGTTPIVPSQPLSSVVQTPAASIPTMPSAPVASLAVVNAISPTPSNTVTLVGTPQFAVGNGAGGTLQYLNPDQSVRFTATPFPGMTGGVRTAVADFNGDGVPDVVAGTGPGGPTRVVVLDGKTQAVLFDLAPFEAAFTGGVYVAAGDVNGDGRPDLVITPDEGGGPRVRVFSGQGFVQLADFLGIEDPNFRGGARVAVGDMNGDGTADLIVAAGFGGGPRIAGFDGRFLSNSDHKKLFADYLAFEPGLRNGTFVAVGDLDGDGKADLIAGGGPGGGPRVSSFPANELLAGSTRRGVDFFAGDPANRGGVRVAVKNLDDDAKADLVVGSGTGATGRVTGYAGKKLSTGASPSELFGLDEFAGFTGGVFVG